jgi:hypothetical protein
MIRKKYLTIHEVEVRKGLQDLFKTAQIRMQHPGDLLVCQQNGFNGFSEMPAIGSGDEGLNNTSSLNSVSFRGLGDLTDDEDYFKNLTGFFDGTTEFEFSLQREKNTYLNIWESNFFLRILTQVVNLANGLEYDWDLDISVLTPNGKNKHIREQIIKRLEIIPSIHNVVAIAYNRNIRNAIAHSQYHCVQGGIWYDNFGSDKYADLQAIGFEDWEQKYCMTYFLFIGIFQTLKQIKDEFYFPLSMTINGKGIPIRIPDKNNKWIEKYIYPNHTGDTWRFVKT